MGKLENKIKDVIKGTEKDLSSDINRLYKISEEFNKLVDAGLITPRRYNLMTINDTQTIKYDINC